MWFWLISAVKRRQKIEDKDRIAVKPKFADDYVGRPNYTQQYNAQLQSANMQHRFRTMRRLLTQAYISAKTVVFV